MNDFLQALGPFAWGFVIGYFWYPIWTIAKRIWSEAKLASQEWKRPDKDR